MDKRYKRGEASAIMEQFEIKIERPKPDPIDEVINLLKKLLDCCLYCITCGCYSGPNDSRRSSTFNGDSDYSSILMDNERRAVQNLLQYLEDDQTKNPVLDEEHVRALSILTYSDNTELQRSAALCYSEVSEKMKVPITNGIAIPLVALLKSHDTEVQKASTLAVSNFAVNGPEINKLILQDNGALLLLIPLLYSDVIEVQCNACGCITTLATTDGSKRLIATENGIPPLLVLVQSTDLRVQRNAAGAILNLTHILEHLEGQALYREMKSLIKGSMLLCVNSAEWCLNYILSESYNKQSNRTDLVNDGAIPILIETLQNNDHDIQYYSSAALSNIAINEKHRAMMVAIGCHDVIEHMIRLLMSRSERVKCQACFALRNLASDVDTQALIVQYRALPALQKCIKTSRRDTRAAAMACIRNLSIHKANEVPIMSSEILSNICDVLCDCSCPEAQRHAAGTLRNLTVGDHAKGLIEQGCLTKLCTVLLNIEAKQSVLAEITAALAVLADDDEVKHLMIQMHDGKVYVKMIAMATLSMDTEVQYNSAGTLGQLALISIPTTLKTENLQGVVLYIDKFVKSEDPNFVHIALWTLVQLLKDPLYLQAFRDQGIDHIVSKLTTAENPPTIQELAEKVLQRLQGQVPSSSSSTNSD